MTEAAPPAPAGPPVAPATFPGKGLGIAGVIVAIFAPLIGIILSAIARSQSKKAGFKNGPATAGLIIGIILLVIEVIVAIVLIAFSAAIFGNAAAICAEYGNGEWVVNGITYTCNF